MAKERHKLLQIPQGTETFYLEEASRHRHLARQLENLFDSWGYLPVQTPVFDFYDIYQALIDRDKAEDIYRLFDRKGELLMLRSDITLFLAKQMGVILEDKDLPVRVSYADSILRYQHSEDISRQEFFQVGAELIGKEGSDADLEVLLLLIESLEALKLPPSQIHLGTHRILTDLFGDLDPSLKVQLAKHIRQRNWSALEALLDDTDYDTKKLLDLLSFVGSPEESEETLKNAVKDFPQLTGAINDLKLLFAELTKLDKQNWITLDFSEVGQKSYYTGIFFEVYTEGIPTEIATGGRYDKLLSHFGFDAPSAGFSLFLRKVESVTESVKDKEVMTIGEGASFAERYQKAKLLRQEGKKVIF
ncbi:ATP phosphoribosyltransferase regulatory subunit [Spirochaeta cellobiosiphila]|uniref:ATP phosphoribosyltransferase regulatory subunit n=1 Tax=Spirochaeta cellobiosiphila TaxID=504483 RepID=UPI0003F7E112|nr:ATP phosphoribosyltransferase regulatory subunit [Spirochaeta cellobiosiphila]